MPRAFVPCLYRESLLETRQIGVDVLSCDVIELFDVCVVATHALAAVMGPNSHQYTRRDDAPRTMDDHLGAAGQARRLHLRQAVCTDFDAAMAALE